MSLTPLQKVVALFILLMALFGLYRMLPAFDGVPHQGDFFAYYYGAKVLNLGLPLYDTASMNEAGRPDGYRFDRFGYAFPPLLAWLLRPLARLDFETARTVWFGLNCLFLIVSTLFLAGLADIDSWPGRAASLAGTLVMPAVLLSLSLGQINIFLLACLSAALVLALKTSNRTAQAAAGFLVALAAAVKLFPALLVLVFLLRRRWAALAGSVIGGLVFFATGLFFICGWEGYVAFFLEKAPLLTTQDSVPINQSVWAVMDRLWAGHEFIFSVLSQENYVTVFSRPLIDAPRAGYWAGALATLVILAVSAWVILRPPKSPQDSGFDLALDYSLALLAALAVNPIVWTHYYSLALIPIFVILRAWRNTPSTTLSWGLLVGIFLLVLTRYVRAIAWFITASPIFMTAGLAGVLVLGGVIAWLRLSGAGNARQKAAVNPRWK